MRIRAFGYHVQDSTNVFAGTAGGKVYLWDVASNSTQPQSIGQVGDVSCDLSNSTTNPSWEYR